MADAAAKKKKTKKPAAAATEETKAVEETKKAPKKWTALRKHKSLLKRLENGQKLKGAFARKVTLQEKDGKALTDKEKKELLFSTRKELKLSPKHRSKCNVERSKISKEEREKKQAYIDNHGHPSHYKLRQLKKAKVAKWREIKKNQTPEEKKARFKPVHKDSLKKCGRLYCYSVFTGYRRGLRNQHEGIALLKVEGCKTAHDARWYCGKKAAFVYKAKRKTKVPNKPIKNKMRVIWGKVTRPHGHTGKVRAKFDINLPSTAMGKKVRIMLYPSNI